MKVCMSNWFGLFLLLALLGVIIVLIGENRHPVKTLAWIMVLVFLPVAGLVLYLFFGTDNRKRRLVKDEDLKDFKSYEQVNADLAIDNPQGEYKDLQNLLRFSNQSIPLKGNALKNYTEFDAMFADMLEDIRSAKDHIHIEFFKIEDDAVGRALERELVQKASLGVEVRVQYDDAANLSRRAFFKRLRRQGIKVQPFLKIRLPFISYDTNYRNHRKIVVVDGRVAYLGGMNLAERYSTGIRGGKWRDTHLRIEGPAALEAQVCFLMDWQFSTKEHLADSRYFPKVAPAGEALVQVASSGPMDEYRVIMQAIVQMIAQSREYIYIQSPYLIPTEPVLFALRNAALAGVDVRLMIPYRGDKGIVPPLASRSYVKEVIHSGVKVYFYNTGYMHSKAIVSDDKVCTIGSTNVDFRSYEQDFEINAFIYDSDMAVRTRDAFLQDQELCTLVDEKSWNSRPWHKRFAESLARLASPLL